MQNLIFSIFPNQNFVDLGLFQFGWERCTPAHSFGPAARNHYLFHYILSGTGTLMADDSKGVTQTYSIKSMQGFMIFPNQITTYVADKQLPWEYVWLEFDGLRVKSLLDTIGLSLDKPVYHARNKSLREDMANEMLYISRHKDESPFHLIGHLYLFLDYLLRSAADEQLEHGSKLREFYIHEALTYIEHNFQNEITIEDIAEPHVLRQNFQGSTGENATGIPAELPHAQSGGAAEADQPFYRRCWAGSGVCQPDALFQSIQEQLRHFPQRMAVSEPYQQYR